MPVQVPFEPVSPDFGDKVITVIQLIYGIPSFMLLVFFLFFLGCSKSYKHSFYRLVQLDLLTNILVYTNTWPGNRLAKLPLGVMMMRGIELVIPGYLTISRTLFNVFQHMQFCSSAALNLHRISSVLYYKSYEKFWSRFYPLYFLFSIVYSSLPVLAIHRNAAQVSLINDTLMGTYHWDIMSQYVFVSAVFSVIYITLILAIGFTTAFLVSKTVRSINRTDHGVSKKLTRIALTSGGLYAGILFWSIVNAVDSYYPFLPDATRPYRMDILMFSSDMITLTLPYILLIFDSNIQKDVLKLCSTPHPTKIFFVSSTSVIRN